MEPQIVLKIENNHTLKASNFPGGMPPDPPRILQLLYFSVDEHPNNFYPHTPMQIRDSDHTHQLANAQLSLSRNANLP